MALYHLVVLHQGRKDYLNYTFATETEAKYAKKKMIQRNYIRQIKLANPSLKNIPMSIGIVKTKS